MFDFSFFFLGSTQNIYFLPKRRGRTVVPFKLGQITYLAILPMHVYGIRMVLVERHVNVALDPTGPHFVALLSVCCLMYSGSA